MNFKKVLLPMDFSRPASQLLNCLHEFQTFGLEEVVLIHVIDERTNHAEISYRGLEQELLETQKKKLEGIGLKVKVRIPVAIPNLELVKIAAEEQVSMILIPSHGQGFIKDIFLGSTTNDVIRISPIPVMIEKYEHINDDTCSIKCLNKFKKVLVPLDFSIHTSMLLEEIKSSANLIQRVILLSVIEGSYNKHELAFTIHKRVTQIDLARLELEKLGIEVGTIVLQGGASTKILAIAEQEDVSLIIMGKRGGGLIKSLLLGSTAHEVARRSSRPVLLIPISSKTPQ